MWGVASTTSVIGLSFTTIGTILTATIATIIATIVALLGLGFALSRLAGWIMNTPGSWGYNSQYGSGWSRFNRAKTHDSGGGHMKAYEF